MATEAVLFDYGLTLVTFEFPRDCLLRVLQQARTWLGDASPSADWLLFHVLHPLEDELEGLGEDEVDYLEVYERAWRRVGLEPGRDVLYRILDGEQLCWDRAVQVVAEALSVLDALRGRGVKTALASNAPFPPEMMTRQVTGNGIGERMDAVVFSSMIGRRKPAPELYRTALDALAVRPERALYVGDRQREDYDGPRAIGMRALLCTANARTVPAPGTPSIDSLHQLLDLL